MASADIQRHERLPISVRIEAFDCPGSASRVGVTSNVSESGLFALLEPAPAVGEIFPMEVKLRRRLIRALARVVWKRDSSQSEGSGGVGVEFLVVRDKPSLQRDLEWHKARLRPCQ